MAHLHHEIAALTLGRMARLVAGDRNTGDRAAGEVLAREVEVVVTRVVMVAQMAGGSKDSHAAATGCVEHTAGNLLTGLPVRGNAGPTTVRGVDITLSHEADHRRDQHDDQIERVVSKAVIAVVGHGNPFRCYVHMWDLVPKKNAPTFQVGAPSHRCDTRGFRSPRPPRRPATRPGTRRSGHR
ncbi:Uncharacterised protein [Collinsella intestinalis]|nr:Uncharacterised protein [Collinsella intestinalis]